MLDQGRIRETRDRSESLAVLDALRSADDEDALAELAWTLEVLDDPRTLEPLRVLAADRAQRPVRREAALAALREMTNAHVRGDAELRRAWAEGDEVERRDALWSMGLEQRELIEAVLAVPEHPLHAQAVSALTFGFTFAWASEHLVRALAHPASEVRKAAADALLWSEPASATEALLRASADDDEDVASAALLTLAYYPTRATIVGAHAARGHASARVREAALDCLGAISHEVLCSLAVPAYEARLRDWLGSTWELLEIDEGAIAARRKAPPASAARAPGIVPPWSRSATEFELRFDDLDCEWTERTRELWSADWTLVPVRERGSFVERLVSSSDAIVREQAARALAEWNERSRLIALLSDPCFAVRKSAAYQVRRLGRDPELAARVWAYWPSTRDTHAYETLETAIALSEPAVWIPRACAIACDRSLEETSRTTAIRALAEAKQREAIASQLDQLLEPPPMTWSFHRSLAGAAISLDLPLPDLAHLGGADHLEVQLLLADAEVAVRRGM